MANLCFCADGFNRLRNVVTFTLRYKSAEHDDRLHV